MEGGREGGEVEWKKSEPGSKKGVVLTTSSRPWFRRCAALVWRRGNSMLEEGGERRSEGDWAEKGWIERAG
jgi:hypothetical protein